MPFVKETLSDGKMWWRVADPVWENPLDPGFAKRKGGRWNPPGRFAVLYLNENLDTARLNLANFAERQGFVVDDLLDEKKPVAVGCKLPGQQEVCDAYSDGGLVTAGLPMTYPCVNREPVPHSTCQVVGTRINDAGLRGVLARSASSCDAIGKELAWFPEKGAVATLVQTLRFMEWFAQ